jgi:hypothetical protein
MFEMGALRAYDVSEQLLYLGESWRRDFQCGVLIHERERYERVWLRGVGE